MQAGHKSLDPTSDRFRRRLRKRGPYCGPMYTRLTRVKPDIYCYSRHRNILFQIRIFVFFSLSAFRDALYARIDDLYDVFAALYFAMFLFFVFFEYPPTPTPPIISLPVQ